MDLPGLHTLPCTVPSTFGQPHPHMLNTAPSIQPVTKPARPTNPHHITPRYGNQGQVKAATKSTTAALASRRLQGSAETPETAAAVTAGAKGGESPQQQLGGSQVQGLQAGAFQEYTAESFALSAELAAKRRAEQQALEQKIFGRPMGLTERAATGVGQGMGTGAGATGKGAHGAVAQAGGHGGAKGGKTQGGCSGGLFGVGGEGDIPLGAAWI